MGQQKGDWHALMSSDATAEENRLNMYDIVRYPIDGIKQYFMVISSEIMAGTLPTDVSCYMQMTMKGDKGDTGYTPVKGVDYFDGVSGLGLTPRGEWIRNREYFQYDLVSYQQFLWYCTEDNLAQEPSDSSTILHKMPLSIQTYIGTDRPDTLEEGGLWLHLQDDGHIVMKKRNSDNTFEPIYPETFAAYVKDVTGQSLQRKIYQHYFDRDDIQIKIIESGNVYTYTATLLTDPNITVATRVATDHLDSDKTCTEELTCYDETGVFVMYKCKTVLTVYEDGSYTMVPTVIIEGE